QAGCADQHIHARARSRTHAVRREGVRDGARQGLLHQYHDARGVCDARLSQAPHETREVARLFLIDRLLFVAALLIIFGILSSKFSARLGLPVLVLFVIVGMLAGSDGIGGLVFENWTAAHAIGTVALAIILFDGGLRTSLNSFRLAVGP